HRGYCPWAERAVASSKSCSSDTDCALDEKCCPIEGHQRCAKAMPANPGLCPKKPLPPVSFTCKNKCEDDRSCPEDQKCCFVDCGLKCVPPESHHISGDQVELDRDEDAPLPDGGHG
ncbi:WAP four-disulfide core domain protein 8-like, partial [Sceloporus undulatus]|uniref:WAP four-disulfide core domain protein 8-like n=1 Tax=Sceloporus undulatus TaxID=8520 RepID=UPI001C4CE877